MMIALAESTPSIRAETPEEMHLSGLSAPSPIKAAPKVIELEELTIIGDVQPKAKGAHGGAARKMPPSMKVEVIEVSEVKEDNPISPFSPLSQREHIVRSPSGKTNVKAFNQEGLARQGEREIYVFKE